MGAQIAQGGQGGGRRRRRSRGAKRRMSDINVTPFVDVMLVLLIIFIVAAPMLTVGVEVDLPRTAAGALPTEQEEPLSVTVTSDGRLVVQDREVPRDELIQLLQAIAAERVDDRIFLRADGAIPYATVMEVMGALSSAGFRNLALVTDSGGPALDGSD
ncbi:MAG: protein TolR [Rhodobacteraceae bacterium]|nr:protein TolR [Paracoccaceae bacterium]